MELSNLANCFKAFASPQRLKLFQMICEMTPDLEKNMKEGKDCCEGIEKAFTSACKRLKLSRSTVSHHLKELQSAGLITCTRSGQSFICRVNREALEAMKKFIP